MAIRGSGVGSMRRQRDVGVWGYRRMGVWILYRGRVQDMRIGVHSGAVNSSGLQDIRGFFATLRMTAKRACKLSAYPPAETTYASEASRYHLPTSGALTFVPGNRSRMDSPRAFIACWSPCVMMTDFG